MLTVQFDNLSVSYVHSCYAVITNLFVIALNSWLRIVNCIQLNYFFIHIKDKSSLRIFLRPDLSVFYPTQNHGGKGLNPHFKF